MNVESILEILKEIGVEAGFVVALAIISMIGILAVVIILSRNSGLNNKTVNSMIETFSIAHKDINILHEDNQELRESMNNLTSKMDRFVDLQYVQLEKMETERSIQHGFREKDRDTLHEMGRIYDHDREAFRGATVSKLSSVDSRLSTVENNQRLILKYISTIYKSNKEKTPNGNK